MSKRRNHERVQDALNMTLSGLQDDPWLAQRVISEAECGKKHAGKRISAALILAVVLMLLSVTAVAAILLSGKDFVSQYMAPLSEHTESETWSREELQYIEKVAMENGLSLTEDILAGLQTEDAVFKETLMRLFMNMELGDSPASWPLADQAWYDDLLLRYGLIEERTRFMPDAGEISEADALSAAAGYAQDRWQIDLNDSLNHRMYVQYMRSTNDNDEAIRMWDIEYAFPNGYTYVICLSSSGDVMADRTYVSVPERAQAQDKGAALDADVIELMWRMTDDSFYNVSTLASFKADYAAMIHAEEDKSTYEVQIMLHLLDIPYALPSETDITPEEALVNAKAWATAHGWLDEWLGWCKHSVSYRIYEGEQPVYRVCFKLTFENRALFYRREMPFGFVVYIDPATGTVSNSMTLHELDDFERCCEFPDPHDTASNPGNG